MATPTSCPATTSSSRSTRTTSAPSPACRRTSAGTASSPATATSSPRSCSGTIRSADRRTTTTSTSSTPTATSPATPASDFPIGGAGVGRAGRRRRSRWKWRSSSTSSPGPTPVGTVKGFFMVIDRFFADPSKLLELQFNGFFAVDPAKNIAEGSIFGHAASRGAMAVAATGAVENIDGTANPGLDIIEEFSSRGPSRIFFTPDRRAGAGSPPQAEHDRGRRHLGDRRQLLHAVLRDLGVGAARGGRRGAAQGRRPGPEVRPASPASCARPRSSAARPASTRRGASA